MTTTSTLDRADRDPADDSDPALQPTEPVTLQRRRGALALVGIGAAATALAYLWRAVGGDGGPLAYVVAAVLLPVAAVHLAAWWDARVPLLVADETGIRLREQNTWTGLRWDEVAGVSLAPSRLPRRDARLEVGTRSGSTCPLPLAMVDPADVRALPEVLRGLAPALVEVVVAEPEHEPGHEPEPEPEREPGPEPEPAAETEAQREPWAPTPARVARADVVVDSATTCVSPAPGSPPAHEGADTVTPLPEPLTEPEPGPGSAREQVIGPRLVEARQRLRLSVDDLAERTRIRPHVIEAIETDDFSACGGDVYVRGHLRALGRMLGTDADLLVREFDAHYSAGPVTARRVFEAELAGGGPRSVRTTTGAGPRWSVLIGVVLVLVLVWGLARLLAPGADDADSPARSGSPSSTGAAATVTAAGAAARFAGMGERVRPTRLRLEGLPDSTASSGSTDSTGVIVRTRDGVVVFEGSIGPGQVEQLSVPGDATVVAQQAGTLAVEVNGRPAGRLGEPGEPSAPSGPGEPVRRTFTAA